MSDEIPHHIEYTKSKVGNRGNTARKQEKHRRKPQKHQEKHAKTSGKMVGNRKLGKHNIGGITLIIMGTYVSENKRQNVFMISID